MLHTSVLDIVSGVLGSTTSVSGGAGAAILFLAGEKTSKVQLEVASTTVYSF